MKIALLTIWHEKNYGAEMQAYATIKILQLLGHNVELIDFRLSDTRVNTFKGIVIGLLGSLTLETCKFRRFWSKYIPKTRRYRSKRDLMTNPPHADIYMIGSDQVWNPDITGDAAIIFFLPFGSKSIKRIAYAPSFGTNNWLASADLTKQVKDLLSSFAHVSCREETGVNILRQVFNIRAQPVLDPTLLHLNYEELIGPVHKKNILSYYPLSDFVELETCSKEIAAKMGLKFRNINAKRYLIKRITWNRASIEDWIRNIAESAFVVTPSFHGVAFSLIYHVPFIVIKQPNIQNRSSRITDLLSILGLENRFFNSTQEALLSEVWMDPIDFKKVDQRLHSLREKSIEYIKNSIMM